MRPISLLLLCLLALSGCRYGGPADPYAYENPYTDPEIKRVGVAPFLFSEKSLGEKYDFDLTGFETAGGRYVLYSEEIGRAFAQELAQFEGFEVTPPAVIVAEWQKSIREGNELNPLAAPDQARALAKRLRLDAIVVGEIRSYDPYEYPRLEIAWQLLYVGRRRGVQADIRALERQGSGRPFPLGNDLAKLPLYYGDLVIDSRNQRTRRELDYYARGLTDEGTGFETSEEMIRKRAWPDFFRFASWFALMEAFEFERAR